jgi:hypothetical protein
VTRTFHDRKLANNNEFIFAATKQQNLSGFVAGTDC